MRMVSVGSLQSGMRLAKPIYSSDGRILLQEEVELTSAYIRRLKAMAVTYVYIEDSDTADINIEETVSPSVRQHVVKEIKRLYDRMSDPVTMQKMVNSGELGREFSKVFEMLYQFLRENDSFVVNMGAIYSMDAYLYQHCMNVGVMASVLGGAMGMPEDRIKHLGIGAMLHDIGKLEVDKAILDKPGKLDKEEREAIERHCEYGYDILRKQPDLSILSAHCALQHHEKFDGTGYPRRLAGEDIHEFGRLLAVPDVFDALTANRVYRKAFLPHEALEFIYSNNGSHFDPIFVDLFIKHVNIYPNGLPVQLSTGAKGVVARSNQVNLQRPVILVLEEEGQSVKAYELDLAAQLNVTITGCDIDSYNTVVR